MADVKAPAGGNSPAPGAPAAKPAAATAPAPTKDDDLDLETPGTVTKEQKKGFSDAFAKAREQYKTDQAGGLSLGRKQDGSRPASKGPAAGAKPGAKATAPAPVADPAAEDLEGDDLVDDGDDGGESVAEPLEGDEEGDGGETVAEGAEGDVDETLVVEIPGRREGEEALRFVAENEDDANRLRELVKGNMRREETYRIRDEAESYRADADELRYKVELDPAGFMMENLRSVDDLKHLVQYALTRGQGEVLTELKDWLDGMITTPAAFVSEKRNVDSDRIKRRDSASREVGKQRYIDNNARAVVRSVRETMEASVPATWDDKLRADFFDDVISDIQREAQRRNALFDPKDVPNAVKARLARYGGVTGASADPAAPNGKRPGIAPAKQRPTGADLKKASDIRRRAAAPGPGAGSTVAKIPPLPPGKTHAERKTAIKRGFAHLRRFWNANKSPS